ncbi:glycerol-3-phosphate acyltransferase, partial [uncultured Faecalibaculum sp.]
MYTALCILLGYLLGSIPFALVIGKVFYKTDVRQFGSGNLGGSNTGRVLGSKAG